MRFTSRREIFSTRDVGRIDDCSGITDHPLVFFFLLVLGAQGWWDSGGLEASDLKERLTLANERREKGALGEAEAICRLLLQETRVLGERNRSYAVALNCLGAVLYDQARKVEVISVLEEALPILEGSSSADNVQLAACRYRLGVCYRNLGRYREAEPLLAAAAPVIEKQFGPRHPQTASALLEWGLLLRDTGRCVESEALLLRLLRSFRIRQETLGRENSLSGIALAGLGTAYTCLGRYAEAESSLRRSVSILEKPSGAILAATLLDLGEVYYLMGSFGQAESALRRAAAIIQGVPQAASLRVEVLVQLAQLQRRSDEAERLLNEAAILAENTFGKSNVQLARVLSLLGDVYTTRREDQRADDVYHRTILLIQSAMGPKHSSVAIVLVRLALLRQTQGRLDEARSLFEKALEIDRKTIGPQHLSYGQHLADYAVLLRKMKQKNEAKEAEARAWEIAQENRVNTFTGSTVDVRELHRH